MADEKAKRTNPITGRYEREFVDFACPICKRHRIVCLPEEAQPTCEFCKVEMIMKEVLTEGKY